MSTWYKIASEAKLRKDVTRDEVEKAIQSTGLPCIGSDGSQRGDDQFFVEQRDTNNDGFPGADLGKVKNWNRGSDHGSKGPI